jgi:hypothetical protein
MHRSANKICRKLAIGLILPIFLLSFLPTPSRAESHVLVRYFHGDVRCSTCLQFEDWSKTAAESFPEELADGRLQWQPINFDQPENQHYIKDYGLADKSLVLVREEDGKSVRWKNVEEFWDFGEDQKTEFLSLVKDLITDFLKN